MTKKLQHKLIKVWTAKTSHDGHAPSGKSLFKSSFIYTKWTFMKN